ncbi:MAG: dienelactone hydrolase, partial [Nannocystaceae bacterium]
EIPGITPQVANFARRVSDEGLTVAMPLLFGTPGKPISRGYAVSQLARACLSREFSVLAKRRSSPITVWLRALCRSLHAELGGPGVGAIGMCLTGNFALSLMVDPAVAAPVLSQPSLPFSVTPGHAAAIAVSDEELSQIRRRTQEDGLKVLGLRFTHDVMCPASRFATLRRELGEGFEGIEIDSSPGNSHDNPLSAHSVVTTHLVDREGHPTRVALDRVLAMFRERLKPSGSKML